MEREYFSINSNSFRRFDATLLYIAFNDVKQFLQGKFSVSNKDTGVFFVSYIDFEFGILFRPLCAAHFEGNKFITNEPNPEIQADVRWQNILDKEYTVIDTNEIDMDKFEASFCFLDEDMANQSESIKELRQERALDPFRNRFIPDNIDVILVHEKLEPETVVVKPIGFEDDGIIGILDVEPHQNVGYHAGDLITFSVIVDGGKPMAASHMFKSTEIKDNSNYVEASIRSISLDKDVSIILNRYFETKELSSIDKIFEQSLNFVQVPKTAKIGDIVFFYLSETSVDNMYNIKTQVEDSQEEIPEEYMEIIGQSLLKSQEYYEKFGKCIFAYTRVAGTRLNSEISTELNKENTKELFAPIDNITLLDSPIPLKDLKLSVNISSLLGTNELLPGDFEKIKNHILEAEYASEMPLFFKLSKPTQTPVNSINTKNWIFTANEFRRRFITSFQLKKYFIDFLMDSLDEKKEAYKICKVLKPSTEPFLIDYVINFDEKLLPVVVRQNLSTSLDQDTLASNVCYPQKIILNEEKKLESDSSILIQNKVLVIDMNTVYVYSHHNKTYSEIFHFKDLKHDVDLLAIRSFLLQGLQS